MGKVFKFGCLGGVGLLALIIIVAVASGGNKGQQTAAAASGAAVASTGGSGSASTAAKSSAAASAAPKVGDTVTAGNWSYQLTKVDKPGKSIDTGNQFEKLDALGTWLVVYMTLKNVGKQNFGINDFDFELQDSAGTKSKVTDKIVEMNAWLEKTGLKPLGGQIPPGVSIDTALLFDINPDAKGFKLNLIQARQSFDLGV
ncbi:MAG TPA: DUF4352 domain-containing protein [Chloroflexota bacterium]|nr:DUF4352 domain-containing protein [Chloroflexota bacterium]